MTFADPRHLRAKQIAALEEQIARAETDEERARLTAELRELKRWRWSRLLTRRR
jgi:hypothetical protein